MTQSEIINDALIQRLSDVLTENLNLSHKVRYLQEQLLSAEATISRMLAEVGETPTLDQLPHHINHE